MEIPAEVFESTLPARAATTVDRWNRSGWKRRNETNGSNGGGREYNRCQEAKKESPGLASPGGVICRNVKKEADETS